MRQGRIVILHVFDDEKFFDSASDFFDSIPGIENLYYMYMPDNSSFKFIKKREKIELVDANRRALPAGFAVYIHRNPYMPFTFPINSKC